VELRISLLPHSVSRYLLPVSFVFLPKNLKKFDLAYGSIACRSRKNRDILETKKLAKYLLFSA